MTKRKKQVRQLYGIELLGVLPLDGGMQQALPDRRTTAKTCKLTETVRLYKELIEWINLHTVWSNHNVGMAYVIRDLPLSGAGAVSAATYAMQNANPRS